MKEISLLEKSIINSKFFDSKIRTCSVSWKEKYVGHLIGPLGLILVVNTVAALVENFSLSRSAQCTAKATPR